MKLALITDIFYPQRSSGAVQLLDLAIEFVKHGYQVTVMVPDANLTESAKIEVHEGVRIIRLKSPPTTNMRYITRTKNECLMPFTMLKNLRKSQLANEVWDGVIWYSPSIFLGPMAKALKKKSGCKSYLIIRDIFPEWALDLGLIKKGPIYYFFKKIAEYQYSVADVIGVQTKGNLTYFNKQDKQGLEVLPNWLAKADINHCSIKIDKSKLAGRKIFVYAGNMGVAQGMDILLSLAENLQTRDDLGFVFVGRGKDFERLQEKVTSKGLSNILFFDEIDPSEIPALYAQCTVGLVALDPRHKTHNIPGKFISYMRSGLPVLAYINLNNDLVSLIKDENVGMVATDASITTLTQLAEQLVENIDSDKGFNSRCQNLADKMFSPTSTVKQITAALEC